MTSTRGIGGYFELAPARAVHSLTWLADAKRFQSGRAAIAALFLANGASAVWVPYFICSAVLEALAFARVRVRGYELSPTRGIPDALHLGANEWLLCVDYFGISKYECDNAIARFGANRVVIDASQSLLHAPRQEVATIYSPRKFCGVPDGGLLLNAPYVAAPSHVDEKSSIERSQHLLLRAAGETAAGYTAFQQAEASLINCEPSGMSAVTTRLLASVDIAHLRAQRVANYEQLAGILRQHGYRIDPLPADAVPLCCPLTISRAAQVRAELARRGIFTPTYWPDIDLPFSDTVGRTLRYDTLYLPCDQRYGRDDMTYVAQTFLEAENSL